MGLHRATATSGSAAIRSDAQKVYYYSQNYHSCDISPNPAIDANHRPLFPAKYDHAHHTSAPYSDDPAQPLLPTTRFHSLPLPSSSPPLETGCEPTSYEADYHRTVTPKSASGMYIGLLCIAIVWLLPIGIIVSGGASGEVAAKVNSLLGQPRQTLFRGSNSSEPLALDNLRRGGRCLRYRTREYTAKSNAPSRGQVALKECRKSYAKIHDIELKPTFCENLGTWSGIWAHWVVDFDEPDCETTWTQLKDEGCQAITGRHRLTAKLDHLNRDDDWRIMCSTTPMEYRFNGKRLPIAQRCERVNDDVIGIWDILDLSCPPPNTLAS